MSTERLMMRREAIQILLCGIAPPVLARFRARSFERTGPDLARIEREIGGRLGISVLDVATRQRLLHRADERFPMCSTFKLLLAAQVLARVDAGTERLVRRVAYAPADLLDYSPVTRTHAAEGSRTIADLAAAAVQTSDNTAANLLLRTVGGPPSLTAYLRHLGDRVTRLDRIEPALNSAEPGDVRDTTTPNAMLQNLERLLVGNVLREGSRARLTSWLEDSTTGAERLRAGVPKDWRVGDKTGSGAHGATNDVAIMWPPRRPPVLVAAYLVESEASAQRRNAALAEAARQIASWVATDAAVR